jgi:hypothetical protein
MDDSQVWKTTKAFGVALAITSVLSALLVVAKELSQHTVMVWMKKMTGHHWVTHGLLALVLFLILGFVLTKIIGGRGMKMTGARLVLVLASGVIIGDLIIAAFYLIGD